MDKIPTHKETWVAFRRNEKKKHEDGMVAFLEHIEDIDDYAKMQDLTDLYLKTHDLITQIGVAITKISTEYNPKS
tara:strand:- start:454 stop:678 length:225 start_codon:yes stop_codon:yes gene_type:complete